MVSPARLLAACLAAVAVSGCSRPTGPPPSAFFSGIDGIKLKAIADQCAPAAVKKWGMHGWGSISSSKYFEGDFQCEPEALDEFLQVLKVELEKTVGTYGGRVASSATLDKDQAQKAKVEKIGGRREPPNVALRGFQLDYEVGAARGEILVIVSQLTVPSGWDYPLCLEIVVVEPAPAGERPTAESKRHSGR